MKLKEIVEKKIIKAKQEEISDIHFSPKEDGVQIFYRKYNKLYFETTIEQEYYERILRYVKFKSSLDISVSIKAQDGSFIIKTKEDDVFVRVSTLPLLRGESLVVRLLKNKLKKDYKQLAYHENDLEEIKNNILNNNGLFIFTGPTGSGKTTIMYSILEEIVKSTNKKVITIENPIEIVNTNFVQVQINEERNINYSNSLKAVLRQDPDIIMIGEIRDEETVRNVFRATLTGHTVISTMHTKNVYGVIERFLDFGFLQSEIESILIGISNQRLILNEKEEIKCIFEYVLFNEINDLIENKKVSDSLEKKISKIKK